MSVATWSPDILREGDKIPRRVVTPRKVTTPFVKAQEKRPPHKERHKSHLGETWSTTPVSTWSPDLLHSGERMPRRIVTIPRDQQALLDRPDAWSRRGIPNVPPSVLEGVKKFHTLKPAGEPVRPSTEPRTTKENQQTDNECDSDDEGTDISWESSPSEHRHGPALAKASKDLVNKVVAHSSPTPTRRHKLLNSEPEPARAPRHPQARFSLPLDQPVSSLASADDSLELEVPNAVAPWPRTTAREACQKPLEPTPPSAQVIPSTYPDVTHEGPPKPPQPARQRLMKDPNKAWSKHTPPVLASPAAVSTRTAASEQPRTSSLPVNPSGHARPITLLPSAQGDVAPSPHPGHVVQNIPGTEETSHDARSSGSERIPPNGPPSQVPYTAFRLAYPDYKADRNDFIRALLCLNELLKTKSIPRFLYDDFVRVFCRHYMKYIATLDPKSKEILTAVKWYNEHVKTPLYLQGLLTPENLQETLNQYSSEAEYLGNQAKKQRSLKNNVNSKSKAAVATPIEKKMAMPTSETRTPKPQPVVSTARQSSLQRGPTHIEIASDPIRPTQAAAKSPLGHTTANSASTRGSSRTYSASKAALPQARSPEFRSLSPSAKENEPPNRSDHEERSRLSTSRRPPSFKMHPPAPPPPPAQAFKASQHRHQDPPVAVYGKKHSLQADPLQSTDNPLSQQSNAESIAEPRRKKQKSRRGADDGDASFRRFLRSSFSSTPAPPGGT